MATGISMGLIPSLDTRARRASRDQARAWFADTCSTHATGWDLPTAVSDAQVFACLEHKIEGHGLVEGAPFVVAWPGRSRLLLQCQRHRLRLTCICEAAAMWPLGRLQPDDAWLILACRAGLQFSLQLGWGDNALERQSGKLCGVQSLGGGAMRGLHNAASLQV
jgi:hypothetical protein